MSERRDLQLEDGRIFDIWATEETYVQIEINGLRIASLISKADWDRIKHNPEALRHHFATYIQG